MNMHEPYIALYVHDDALHVGKKLPTELKPREMFDLPLSQVVADEFDEAARKLGSTVLGILRLWHPDVFNNWGSRPQGDETETQLVSDFDIAMQLISKSVSDKTKIHVPSIDALLREQSQRTKAAHEFFNESWPAIRTRLEKFA
jgi:hypothetical protein